MAINHRMDETNTVDIFSVDFDNGAVELTEVGSIGGGILISPNDLAAVDEDRFYVVNDHTSKTDLRPLARRYSGAAARQYPLFRRREVRRSGRTG